MQSNFSLRRTHQRNNSVQLRQICSPEPPVRAAGGVFRRPAPKPELSGRVLGLQDLAEAGFEPAEGLDPKQRIIAALYGWSQDENLDPAVRDVLRGAMAELRKLRRRAKGTVLELVPTPVAIEEPPQEQFWAVLGTVDGEPLYWLGKKGRPWAEDECRAYASERAARIAMRRIAQQGVATDLEVALQE
jgi:hypothetical protein